MWKKKIYFVLVELNIQEIPIQVWEMFVNIEQNLFVYFV